MRRLTCPPRPEWRRTIADQGLLWHHDADPFWREGTYYEFSMPEVERIEDASEQLYGMCLEAAAHLMQTRTDAELCLPAGSVERMRHSFATRASDTIYARFDLAFDAAHDTVKMYEINGDTPTMLVESSVVQWFWKADVLPHLDQFNSVHERLVRGWQRLAQRHGTSRITFAGVLELVEEAATLAYLADCAEQAGLTTSIMDIEDVGVDSVGQFVDENDDVLGVVFKLFPTEDMLASPFGGFLEKNTTTWLEPLWKQALSHKALLASLWECFPGHPLLLPASLDASALDRPLPKPFFGREGEGMHPGDEVSGGVCFQQWHELPRFDGRYPVIGSWMIDGKPAGMGIRESSGPITDGTAQFVPHVISAAAPSEAQREAWLAEG